MRIVLLRNYPHANVGRRTEREHLPSDSPWLDNRLTILTKVFIDLHVAKYSSYVSSLILLDFPLSLNTSTVIKGNQQDRKVKNSYDIQNK